MDLYSTSVDDCDTVCYLFDFQETKEPPMKTQKPLIYFLLSGQAPQSKPVKPFNSITEEEEKKRPCPTIALRYWRLLLGT